MEEDEENLKGAVGSKVIQEYLQRYKVGSAYERINLEQKFEFTVLDNHWSVC